jgi:hypothetical protein
MSRTCIAGGFVVSYGEAFLIFSKWSDENTPLLFRSHSPLFTYSMLCGLDSAKNGAIRLRVQGLGYIDVRLSAEFTFEYFDPATHRDTPGEGGPPNPADSLTIDAGIVATSPSGETFLLLEILFT